jgi:hypothetical protein
MAYESKVTNKYFGTTFAGAGRATVQTDGLVEALKTVTPKLQEMGSTYIERQQKEAEVELASLQASGKSLEDIQKIITSGENDKLNSMYATATNDMWIGKTQAAEDWKSVLANQDNYDPKSQSAEEFLNEHVTADFNKGGKYFSGAYASVWNEKKAAFLTQDAQSRFEVRNKEEIDSMADFIKIYQGTENGVTIAQRLETKLNSDGKPPTPKQINAAILQGTEQLIELGDYDRAESFLKSHRGYNGKMEVKSLLDSGNAKAHDLMKQVINGRNTKAASDLKAKTAKDKSDFSNLIYMKEFEEDFNTKIPLNKEQLAEVDKQLQHPRFALMMSKAKSYIEAAPKLFNNPRKIADAKRDLVNNSNKFVEGQLMDYGDFVTYLSNRNMQLTRSESKELFTYYNELRDRYNTNVKLLDDPRVEKAIKRVHQNILQNVTGKNKPKKEQLFDLVSDDIRYRLTDWFLEKGNLPPAEDADPKVKLEYNKELMDELKEISADVDKSFNNKIERGALKAYQTYGTYETGLEENMDRYTTAIAEQYKQAVDADARSKNADTNIEIEKLQSISDNSLIPIYDVILQSNLFKQVRKDVRNTELPTEQVPVLIQKIMDEYGLADNSGEILEAKRNLTDRIMSMDTQEVKLPELDVDFMQQIEDFFTGEDVERQRQFATKFTESIEDVLGRTVNLPLVRSLDTPAKERLAEMFNMDLDTFEKTITKVIK